MTTFPTSDALYLDLTRRLPGWVFNGLTKVRVDYQSPLLGDGVFGTERLCLEPARVELVAKDVVYGPLTTLFGAHYAWLDVLLQQTRITTAGGAWLDMHARGRGTWRAAEEDDERLRARIRRVPETCTDRALQLAADEVVGEGVAEAFTLRMREAVWDQSFFDTGKRFAGSVLPRRRDAGYGSGFFDVARWDMETWADHGLRGPFGDPNDWLVAVVIVPPQVRTVGTFYNREFFDTAFFGDTLADSARYRALRQVVEERRAGGVQVLIWIQPPDRQRWGLATGYYDAAMWDFASWGDYGRRGPF